MNRAVRFRMGIAALVLALSWASGSFLETHAEVGLAPSPASGPATQHLSVPYILGIAEDPNPVPPISVWRRLYPDGQGRLVLNPEGERQRRRTAVGPLESRLRAPDRGMGPQFGAGLRRCAKPLR